MNEEVKNRICENYFLSSKVKIYMIEGGNTYVG